MEKYRTIHVQNFFKVSGQTVRAWAEEFNEYLSANANPGPNRNRSFSQEDLEVFDLVSSLKKEGMTYTDIHATLKSGERGTAPATSPQEMSAIVAGEVATQLELENTRLKQMLLDAQQALKKAQDELQELHEVKEQKIRLETTLEITRERIGDIERRYSEEIKRLHQSINDLTSKVESLSKEAGQEYARGFVEALKQPKNEE